MKEINKSNITQEIENLKTGQSLIIPISEDDCNVIEFLNFQCQSLENLFVSYINGTLDKANSMNLENFLNTYTTKFIEKELYSKKILISLIGENAYLNLAPNSIKIQFDSIFNTIRLFK